MLSNRAATKRSGEAPGSSKRAKSKGIMQTKDNHKVITYRKAQASVSESISAFFSVNSRARGRSCTVWGKKETSTFRLRGSLDVKPTHLLILSRVSWSTNTLISQVDVNAWPYPEGCHSGWRLCVSPSSVLQQQVQPFCSGMGQGDRAVLGTHRAFKVTLC